MQTEYMRLSVSRVRPLLVGIRYAQRHQSEFRITKVKLEK